MATLARLPSPHTTQLYLFLLHGVPQASIMPQVVPCFLALLGHHTQLDVAGGSNVQPVRSTGTGSQLAPAMDRVVACTSQFPPKIQRAGHLTCQSNQSVLRLVRSPPSPATQGCSGPCPSTSCHTTGPGTVSTIVSQPVLAACGSPV